MVNNSVKGRFQLKKDTEEHWNLAHNFIPLAGEPIIYTVDENHTAPRMKVGDGQTYVIDLPFITIDSNNNPYVKTGTKEYWATQYNYVPPRNMILIYSNECQIKQNNQIIDIPKIKVGDGNTYCIDLPFINDDIYYKLDEHIKNTNIHVTTEEKEFWNNKINTSDSVLDGILTITRN